jgi:hypothetical protein
MLHVNTVNYLDVTSFWAKLGNPEFNKLKMLLILDVKIPALFVPLVQMASSSCGCSHRFAAQLSLFHLNFPPKLIRWSH